MRRLTRALTGALTLAALAVLTGLHTRRNDPPDTSRPKGGGTPPKGKLGPIIKGIGDEGTRQRPKGSDANPPPPTTTDPNPSTAETTTDANQAAIDQAFNDLPPFTGGRYDENGNPTSSATSGYLLDGNDRIKNPYDSSGGEMFNSQNKQQTPAPEVENLVKDSPSSHPRGYSQLGNKSDVEMKVAYLMRTKGEEGGENLDLVINNPKGPCSMCQDTLPFVLRPDQTLTVHWIDDNGVKQKSPPFTGNDW
ncbi:hypothetical protein GCM10009830_14830 [Glycomyces endophyticus]|uniref:Uncharacterized protein n=1 Tax=Glycomyces endophyticus TaxID=480996 RepID=A0ABP4SAS5_9ACTN